MSTPDPVPNVVVYTAIFGSFPDRLFRPGYLGPDVAYVAFTDRDAGFVNGWRCCPPAFRLDDARRQARCHKILSHKLFPGQEYVLWVDGCLTPLGNPLELVREYLVPPLDLCVFEHCQRKCVYEEAEACVQLRKDDPQLIAAQTERYRQAGYPAGNGLGETTAVLRRQTPAIRDFNRAWWAELVYGSVRDQLSFDFVCWRQDLPYARFRGWRYNSPHFRWRAHR